MFLPAFYFGEGLPQVPRLSLAVSEVAAATSAVEFWLLVASLADLELLDVSVVFSRLSFGLLLALAALSLRLAELVGVLDVDWWLSAPLSFVELADADDDAADAGAAPEPSPEELQLPEL